MINTAGKVNFFDSSGGIRTIFEIKLLLDSVRSNKRIALTASHLNLPTYVSKMRQNDGLNVQIVFR